MRNYLSTLHFKKNAIYRVGNFLKCSFYYCLKQIAFFGSIDECKSINCVNFFTNQMLKHELSKSGKEAPRVAPNLATWAEKKKHSITLLSLKMMPKRKFLTANKLAQTISCYIPSKANGITSADKSRRKTFPANKKMKLYITLPDNFILYERQKRILKITTPSKIKKEL